jgi:hypothetical protein
VELPVTITETTTPLVSLSAERGITLFNQQGKWSRNSQAFRLANAGPGNLDWAITRGNPRGDNEGAGAFLIDVGTTFKGLISPGATPETIRVQTTANIDQLLPDPARKPQASLLFSFAHRRDEPTIVPVYIEVVNDVLPPVVDKGGVILGLPGRASESLKVE